MLIGCNGNTELSPSGKISSTELYDTVSTRKTKADIIYETDNIRLYGDSTIDVRKISHAQIRYAPGLTFDNFPADTVVHGKYSDIDLRSNDWASNYRTALRKAYDSDSANFAGHYTFVSFGCGSTCLTSFIIDRRNGKVYNSPSAETGYEFRVDSRMLLVNPPDSEGYYFDCSYCKPIAYIFNEQTKTFEKPTIKTE